MTSISICGSLGQGITQAFVEAGANETNAKEASSIVLPKILLGLAEALGSNFFDLPAEVMARRIGTDAKHAVSLHALGVVFGKVTIGDTEEYLNAGLPRHLIEHFPKVEVVCA